MTSPSDFIKKTKIEKENQREGTFYSETLVQVLILIDQKLERLGKRLDEMGNKYRTHNTDRFEHEEKEEESIDFDAEELAWLEKFVDVWSLKHIKGKKELQDKLEEEFFARFKLKPIRRFTVLLEKMENVTTQTTN